ncbi:hypothetical protein HELRODRAFT_183589 [Helobdella robusta]|uniref:Endonuclease/exonuclease/phosphatase domain-containing protein n=1 Tax=Helobdella robusta TaxID=6412 RepID=T1FJW1_HELRO|nr:hypothetical protein HELRODRAFT_183589 [Helobdella robusta]ESO10489.1 hypothetical protein HELRODRAFT_183589 [Helobdella robusta]
MYVCIYIVRISHLLPQVRYCEHLTRSRLDAFCLLWDSSVVYGTHQFTGIIVFNTTPKASCLPFEECLFSLSLGQIVSPAGLSGQRVPRIPGKYAIAEGCCRKIQNGPSMVLRLGTLNVGSLTGRSTEIAEVLERRKIDIYCLQETQ